MDNSYTDEKRDDGDEFENFVNGLDINSIFTALSGRKLTPGNEGVKCKAATRVYRVEMPNGRGPFNVSQEVYTVLDQWHCDALASHEQMGVTEKPFKAAHGHAAYACPSIASLNRWFPAPARRYLESLGGKLVIYEVPKGDYIEQVSDDEVIFSRATAKRIAELSLIKEQV